jgi:hypothetical protein
VYKYNFSMLENRLGYQLGTYRFRLEKNYKPVFFCITSICFIVFYINIGSHIKHIIRSNRLGRIPYVNRNVITISLRVAMTYDRSRTFLVTVMSGPRMIYTHTVKTKPVQ